MKPTGVVIPEVVTVGRSEQIDPDSGLYVVASDQSGARTRFLDVTRAKEPSRGTLPRHQRSPEMRRRFRVALRRLRKSAWYDLGRVIGA